MAVLSVDLVKAIEKKEESMFEKLRIKEHMEVANCQGEHVGTVDAVQDDAIKLTKSDSADDIHHFLKMDDVEKIDDNRVYLKEGARIPDGLGNKATTTS